VEHFLTNLKQIQVGAGGNLGYMEQMLIPLIHAVTSVWETGAIFAHVSFHAHIWLVIDFRLVSAGLRRCGRRLRKGAAFRRPFSISASLPHFLSFFILNFNISIVKNLTFQKGSKNEVEVIE
jgi:hypothetical protein